LPQRERPSTREDWGGKGGDAEAEEPKKTSTNSHGAVERMGKRFDKNSISKKKRKKRQRKRNLNEQRSPRRPDVVGIKAA